jgi:opacity protein-like surface antigen
MSRRITAAAAVFAALISFASAAQAQRALSLGISGGLSLPMGEMADFQGTGYHVAGHANINSASLPFEILLDGTYHSFDAKSGAAFGEKFSYFGAGASAAYVFPGLTMRPYLLGGVGMFFGKADVPGAESESEFGFSAGGGLRFVLSGFNSFLQARVNIVGDHTFVPISFGVVF